MKKAARRQPPRKDGAKAEVRGDCDSRPAETS